MDKLMKMRELIEKLNSASKAYYQENVERMSNVEYDKLYDELVALEEETGTILAGTPTMKVGYELLTNLPKEKHEKPMLSLDKTKTISDLVEWLGSKTGILSWKLDGLTIVLTYSKGKFIKAITRGNGEVGEVVTNNVKVFKNIPLSIPFRGELVLRGEAVISYSDFMKINDEIEDAEAKYKNPRNLCSGSVRQLNNKITAERSVNFFAFSIVSVLGMNNDKVMVVGNSDATDGVILDNSRKAQLNWLMDQGFSVVDFKMVNSKDLEETVVWFEGQIEKNDYPSDGLVLAFDDIAYGETLGSTAKFPRDQIAFKWKDEIKETKLLEIEWSASRTGLINPIALFEPVELEGTTVSRASLHNISIMEDLELGIGDVVCVYKANMIIPQISDNITRSGRVDIPTNCPVCHEEIELRHNNEVKYLYCINPDCPAKQLKLFTLFVSRDAMNIEGLSEATIEKFIAKGLIKDLADIFRIAVHKEEIVNMEGFGEKSYSKMILAIEKARKTTVARLLYGLGIPNVGLSNAKLICRKFNNYWPDIEAASYDQLLEINGVGEVMAEAFINFFSKDKNRLIVKDIIQEIDFENFKKVESDMIFENINFVITGSVEHFKNRDELKDLIEEKGGKVTGTVTSNTNYLINNDSMSGSSKNKKAKELGIPIITELQFIEWFNNGLMPE